MILYKIKNERYGKHPILQEALESIVACVAPFAPHVADELWHRLGHSSSVHIDSWPTYNEQYLSRGTLTIVVQVNGKLRAQLSVDRSSSEAAIVAAAALQERVKLYIRWEDDSKDCIRAHPTG